MEKWFKVIHKQYVNHLAICFHEKVYRQDERATSVIQDEEIFSSTTNQQTMGINEGN